MFPPLPSGLTVSLAEIQPGDVVQGRRFGSLNGHWYVVDSLSEGGTFSQTVPNMVSFWAHRARSGGGTSPSFMSFHADTVVVVGSWSR